MAINHGNMGVGDISSGGPAGAPQGQPAAPPPNAPRRRIDELGDAFTATPQSELNVDMGGPPDQGVVLPNTGDINDPQTTNELGEELAQANDGDPNALEANAPLPAELAEIKSKWDSPELQPEMDEKLVTVEYPDGPETLTVAELKQRHLMHADYSRKTGEVAHLRRRYEAGLQGQDRLVQTLADGRTFLDGIEELAHFEPKIALAFEDAVKMKVEQEIADFERVGKNHELLAEIKAARQAKREAMIAKREAEQYRAEKKAEADRLAQQNRPDVAALTRQLDQFVPRALKAVGLVDNDLVRKMVGPALGSFWQDRTKPLNYTHVESAIKAIKQDLTKQFGAKATARQPDPQIATPQQPARTPAAAPKGSAQPHTRKRIDELGGDWYER